MQAIHLVTCMYRLARVQALTVGCPFIGAMKNVNIDYVPRWAMYLEESRWLNSVKNKAAKVMYKA